MKPEGLERLAANKTWKDQWRAANDSDFTTETLSVLAREMMAANPNTSLKTLMLLSTDQDWRVRASVARNPATPPEILDKLAGDEDRDVRFPVARHPKTMPVTLNKLAKDENLWIRMAVAKKTNTPPEALARMAQSLRSNPAIHAALAANPSTPEETLRQLSQSWEKDVRDAARKNLEHRKRNTVRGRYEATLSFGTLDYGSRL